MLTSAEEQYRLPALISVVSVECVQDALGNGIEHVDAINGGRQAQHLGLVTRDLICSMSYHSNRDREFTFSIGQHRIPGLDGHTTVSFFGLWAAMMERCIQGQK